MTTRAEHREKMKAQGVANAHAAVAMVHEWGGMLPFHELQAKRLGNGAKRAVKLGLLVKVNRGQYVLPEGVS